MLQNNRWIQGIEPILPEIGKIKIGCLNTDNPKQTKDGKTWYPPKKFDHFVVTTLDRDATGNFRKDEEVHKIIGEEPKSIPIIFIYDDPSLNLFTRYASFEGHRLFCCGDGVTAVRKDKGKDPIEIKCPCILLDPDYKGENKCKFNLRLSCLITPVEKFGGVWVFRSTSYLMTMGLMNQMRLYDQATARHIAGIPFELVLAPQTSTARDGKQHTNQIVSINFKGSILQLREKVQLQLSKNTEFFHNVKLLEEKQKESIVIDDVMFPEGEQEEIAAEFYPPEEEHINTETEKSKRKKRVVIEEEDVKDIPDIKSPMEDIPCSQDAEREDMEARAETPEIKKDDLDEFNF
jgi:hypothetical protein